MYRAWGGTIINMSTLPEAKLAAEAEIAYQVIIMSTDYDVSCPLGLRYSWPGHPSSLCIRTSGIIPISSKRKKKNMG